MLTRVQLTPVHESIIQTCLRYNICRSYLYRLIGDGKIEAVKDGKRIKVIVASADAHFASLPKAKIKRAKKASEYASAKQAKATAA
jgi:hypothetical protein